jgi:hypothetical protein
MFGPSETRSPRSLPNWATQCEGVTYQFCVGFCGGVKERGGGFLGAGRGFGSATAGAGAMLAVASLGTDFLRWISIRRR